MRIALYPGTFDPITLGHQEIIERGSFLCDRLYIGIAVGHHKKTLFSLSERCELVNGVLADLTLHCPVEVVPYCGLLATLYQKLHANILIRGLRSAGDFEYERQLFYANQHLNAQIETVFLLPAPQYSFISSTLVRELAQLNGALDGLVHDIVKKKLRLNSGGQ